MFRARSLQIVALSLALSSGCHLVLPLAGAPPTEGDGASPDSLAADGRADRLALVDGSDGTDGAASPCSPPGSWVTLGRYGFDGTDQPLRDSSGNGHHGVLQQQDPLAPLPTLVPGHAGQALHFGGTIGTETCGYQPSARAWAELPAGPQWQIPAGRIALWVRFDAGGADMSQAVLGRDASGQVDGHLSLLRLPDGRIAARMQRTGGPGDSYRCTAAGAAPAEKWIRVELVFGTDLVLCVDGVPGRWEGQAHNAAGTWIEQVTCTAAAMPEGLDQVDLPWALGASNWCSPMIVPPVLPLRGAIDELEIAARP